MSDDSIVQAINIYFKKYNNKHQFVGKTVNQIGFPYWDKSIIFRKTDENPTGRGNSEDSVIVTYIPFVRDSQQFVNASLLVRTTPSDTSFQYLCDWQYAEFGFDTVQTGWNARNVFHVFAMLDRSVFSRNKFRITDENLLTAQETAALSSAGIMFDSTEVVCTYQPLTTSGRNNRNNVLYEVLVCEDYSTCLEIGTGSQCLRLGGANYGPFGCCLISVTQTICTTVWVDIPGSGNGGGNGSGSGGSGGGSGGGETPPECGSTLPGRTNLTDSCGPGWVPVEESPITFNPFNYDTIGIKNSIRDSFPCLFDLLKNGIFDPNLIAQVELYNVFNASQYINLKFDIDWSLDSTDDNAHEQLDPSGLTFDEDSSQLHFATTIYFNPNYIRNASKEAMVSTIFHESIHAYIRYMFAQYTRGLITSQYLAEHFPLHWNWFQNSTPSNSQQHIQMANSYIGFIDSLTRVFYNPFAPSNIKNEVSNALAWRGLNKTTGWAIHPDTCRARAIAWSAENTQKSLIQNYSPGGACGNYDLPYNDSLKLSPPCQ